MHPAKSVIFFTTASGAGYGLAMCIAILAFFGLLPPGSLFAFITMAIALGLIVAGLLASTFHLGHPERAWRALSQWRSSWLSREGVLAILTFIPLSIFSIAWIFFGKSTGVFAIIGMIGAVMSLLTVYTTSMIYASLKTIPAWHNPLTSLGYLILSLMSGFVITFTLCHIFGWEQAANLLYLPMLIIILLALFTKLLYWTKIHSGKPVSTAESATGLGQFGKVSFAGSPHTQDNYLLKEMGFKIARKHSKAIGHYSVVLGFLLPLVLLGALKMMTVPELTIPISIFAMLSMAIGIVLERWLFFAEAKHVVTLYYGESEV